MENDNEDDIYLNLYNEFEKRIREKFGQNVHIYKEKPRQKDNILTPAFIIEMSDIDPTSSMGTGELEVSTRWSVLILISASDFQSRVKIRSASTKLASLFSEKILVNRTYPVVYLGSRDENFMYDNNVEAWTSDFEIKTVVGNDMWDKWVYTNENIEITQE